MSVAGLSCDSQTGCATKADAAGSAAKGQPPAARKVRYRLTLLKLPRGDGLHHRLIVFTILLVAAKKLERDAATAETAQLLLELR